jgi:hypothetical protein
MNHLDSGFALSARPGMTLIGTYCLTTSVMAGLVPAIHVFAMAMRESRMDGRVGKAAHQSLSSWPFECFAQRRCAPTWRKSR